MFKMISNHDTKILEIKNKNKTRLYIPNRSFDDRSVTTQKTIQNPTLSRTDQSHIPRLK